MYFWNRRLFSIYLSRLRINIPTKNSIEHDKNLVYQFLVEIKDISLVAVPIWRRNFFWSIGKILQSQFQVKFSKEFNYCTSVSVLSEKLSFCYLEFISASSLIQRNFFRHPDIFPKKPTLFWNSFWISIFYLQT